MPGYQQAHREHEPKNKEDVTIQRYKQAHINLRRWGCMDANKGIWTWGYNDNVRMRG